MEVATSALAGPEASIRAAPGPGPDRGRTMRALLPTWRPAPLVTFGEARQPEPAPGEALVKVAAFSVNRGETFQLEGIPRPGWRPGKDIAGMVVQTAAGGPPIGSRVVGHPPQAGWAEYAAVPVGSLAELPSAVPDTTGAALPLAGLTALRLLRAAGPGIGRRILLTGASGGVGHYLTELAAAAGGEVTAVTASAERGSRLRALGATRIVHDVTAAAGHYDLVLESTGGESLPAAMAKLADRGTAIWFGQASKTPPTLDFFSFLSGPWSVSLRIFHYADSGLSFRDDLTTLVRLTATGRLHHLMTEGGTDDQLRRPRRSGGIRSGDPLSRHRRRRGPKPVRPHHQQPGQPARLARGVPRGRTRAPGTGRASPDGHLGRGGLPGRGGVRTHRHRAASPGHQRARRSAGRGRPRPRGRAAPLERHRQTMHRTLVRRLAPLPGRSQPLTR